MLKEAFAGRVPCSPHMEFHPTAFLKSWESLSFLYKPGSGRFTAVTCCVPSVNHTRSEYQESTTFYHLFTEPLCFRLVLFLSFCCSPWLIILPGDQPQVLPGKNVGTMISSHDSFKFLNAHPRAPPQKGCFYYSHLNSVLISLWMV